MGHHHHHIEPDAGDTRVIWAVVVNVALTIAQIVGGLLSGSLALIADAIHNLSDAVSLAIAFIARRIARRPADHRMSFGYGRAEIVAALVNYTTLIVIGIFLVYEAVLRFFEPERVDGWLVVIIASFALLIDLITAMLTYRLSKSSVNIRAAFLHNVADALGSIAVIISGTLILLFDWHWIDPLITLLIAGYILVQAATETGPVIRMLMLGAPNDLSAQTLLERMLSIDGVADVHALHLWQLHEHQNALDAHLVIAAGRWLEADAIKQSVKARLSEDFGISQLTLEIECSLHDCRQSGAAS